MLLFTVTLELRTEHNTMYCIDYIIIEKSECSIVSKNEISFILTEILFLCSHLIALKIYKKEKALKLC